VNLNGSGGTTYTWNNGVTNGVSFSPTSTATYTVTGTDANGCVNTDQVTVNVNSLPTINAGPDQTICIGASVTLNGSGGTTYTWNNGVTNGVSFNPISTTTYTVTGTTNGCVNTDQVTVNVNSLPNINGGPDQTICFNGTVVLNGTGGNTYTWNNGVVNNVIFTPSNTMTYTVTGTDINGCVNTDQVLVTVNPLPNINGGPDQTICIGGSVTLNGSGGNNYIWSNGVTNGVSFSPTSTTTYTVTGTNVNGCTNTDVVLVTVNPLPIVNAGVDLTVCESSTIILTGSGATTYTWDNGVTNGVSFVQNIGTVTYTVTGTTLGCINTDQVNVSVIANPLPSFTPSATSGCAPMTINFTNNSVDSESCVWVFSNGETSTSCNPSITFTQGGCYDVSLTTTNSFGCVNTFGASSIICIEDLPNANFTANPNPVSSLDPEVNFTNLTTGASNYIWTFGDESQSTNVINPTHIYEIDSAGNYLVTLIAYSPIGCTDTSYTWVNVYEELIYYVPNTFTPDGDKFNQTFTPVFTSGFDIYDYNLQIYNRWGEVIFESNNHLIGWNGSYGSNGEVSMCQDGVYTWRIEFKLNRWDERRVVNGHVTLIR
jgi:gliding motility-associated-like protein